MSNQSSDIDKGFLDLNALLETVDLDTEDFDQAIQTAQSSTDREDYHQAYLNELALTAMERWLEIRAGEFMVNRCADMEANRSGLSCCLQVGEFRIDVLAVSHLFDETLEIPREFIDNPALASHFYVIVEVSEEESQAIIRGFLRYDQIIRHCQMEHLPLQPATSTYALPVDWFNFEASDVLHYLCCADPVTFGLPVPEPDSDITTKFTITMGKIFQRILDELGSGWQVPVTPMLAFRSKLAANVGNAESLGERGFLRRKLIDLSTEIPGQTVDLWVAMRPAETPNEIDVWVEVYPAEMGQPLPSDLQLMVLDAQESVIVYAQPMVGKPEIIFQLGFALGEAFSVKLVLGNLIYTQAFPI